MRINLFFLLFMLLPSMAVFAQGTGEVIITEYHNRPAKPTQTQLDAALPNNPTGADLTPNEGHTEWFEVYNTTSSPVVMDGWTLSDISSSSGVSTIGSFTLAANSYAVFSGFDIPGAQGGVVFDYFYEYKKPSLNNESSYADAGDTACPDGVRIAKGDGTLVDEVQYDYGYGEYIGNAGSGSCSANTSAIGIPPAGGSSKVSFMLSVDPAAMTSAANDLAANWSYSTIVYDASGNQVGTPGLANDGGPVVIDYGTGEVIITEYHNRPAKPTQTQLDAALPNNPAGADLTPNEGHTEWFEVYNTTNSPVVMDGWTLTDASSSSSVSTIGSFTLAANSYAVFSGFNIPDAQGGVAFDYFYEYKKPSLNNESSYADAGDTACPDGVRIAKGDGTLVDEVLYDYGYGEYIGNAGSGNCSANTSAIGIPPAGGSSKVSFMLAIDPAVMNSEDNDLAANWSYSTEVYDVAGNQIGTPGLVNAPTICAIPTGTAVEMTTTTTASFSWTNIPGATLYQVRYRVKGTTAWSVVGSGSSPRAVSGLQTKRNYQYKVRAQCADGSWSENSEVTNFYTSQCTPPTGVATTFTDLTRMRVRWDNNPDEIKAKIRYRVVGGSWITQNSADGNNFLWVNGLPSGATIQYKVRSNCDGNDWSEYSSPLQTVTLGTTRMAEVISETRLSPNPANEVLNLSFNTADASEVSIVISDNVGKAVLSMNNTYQKGTQRETLDISRLANGYYFLTIYSNDNVETLKFVKSK